MAQQYLEKSFGLIFFWYGILKILNVSPVDILVTESTNWLNIPHFFTFLGLWEVLIGIGLFFKKLNKIGLVLFFLQVPGTFLPCLQTPELCFNTYPWLPTLEGQYIFKNLILIASAFILVKDINKN